MQPTAARSPSLNLVTALADPDDAPNDFMTGNAGIHGGHNHLPFVANLVEIGVADSAEENLDLDILRAGRTARDGEVFERSGGAVCGVGFGGEGFGLLGIGCGDGSCSFAHCSSWMIGILWDAT